MSDHLPPRVAGLPTGPPDNPSEPPASSEWTPAQETAAGVPAPTAADAAITGTAKSGSVLTCAHGTWGGTPTGFVYQWVVVNGVDHTAIPGATAETFTPGAEHVGKEVTCQVAGTNAKGTGDYVEPAPVTIAA